MNHPDTSTY